LLREAYQLVHHVNFSYSDVKEMSRKERDYFISFFLEEVKQEKEMRQNLRNRPK